MNNLKLSEEDEARVYCNSKLSLDLSFHELDELIEVGENYNLLDILSSLYIKKGDLLYNEQSYNEAFSWYNKTLNIYNTTSVIDDNIVRLNNKLASCKINTLAYEEALAYLCNCYSYALKSQNKANYEQCTYNLALIYKKLNDFDNAILYLDRYMDFWTPNDNYHEYLDAVILKANCYMGKNDYVTSIKIYEDLLAKFDANCEKSLGYVYNNLGLCYFNIDKTEIALDYFDKSIAIRRSLNKDKLPRTLIDKSRVYIKEKLYNEAIAHLNEGIKLAEEYCDNEYILEGYLMLEQIYIELNDYDMLVKIYFKMLEKRNDMDSCKLFDVFRKLSKLNINFS